jgi:hypothetical protein
VKFNLRCIAATLAVTVLAISLAIVGLGASCSYDSPKTCAAPVAMW